MSFEIALKLANRLKLKDIATNDFNPENRFITIAKRRNRHYVSFNSKIAQIVPDYVFQNMGGNRYHMGQSTVVNDAITNLNHSPIVLTRKAAIQKVSFLLENDYEIIGNPFMSHAEALFYLNNGLLKQL